MGIESDITNYEAPSYSTAVTVAPKTLVAKFGDSYTQRSNDGMNTMPQKWDLVWEKTPKALADELIAYFESKKGVTNFQWTPYRQSSPRKFICTNWSRRFFNSEVDIVYASLEEVFDND